MSSTTTITKQIELLEQENKNLKGLKKLFEKAVKNEFNMSIRELHNLIDKQKATTTLRINAGDR